MFAIYANQNEKDAQAIAAGLGVLGLPFLWRSPHDYGRGQVEARFSSGIFLCTLRHKGKEIAREYSAAGLPVIVTDLGYVRRSEYRQLGLGGLGWLPPWPCPADRWDVLDTPIKEPRTAAMDAGAPILIIGQEPGDANHGLHEDQMVAWAAGVAQRLQKAGWTAPILWRPHPRADLHVPGLEKAPPVPLEEAFQRCAFIVTINSNTGNMALLEGVPVVYDDAMGAPMFADLAWPLSGILNPNGEAVERFVSSVDARRAYFQRVAFAQWRLSEIGSGLALAFLTEHAIPNKPIEVPASGDGQGSTLVPSGVEPMHTADTRLAEGQGQAASPATAAVQGPRPAPQPAPRKRRAG